MLWPQLFFLTRAFGNCRKKGDYFQRQLNSTPFNGQNVWKAQHAKTQGALSSSGIVDLKVKLLKNFCDCMLSHILIFRSYEHGNHSSELTGYFYFLEQ